MAEVHFKCQEQKNLCAFLAWCEIGREELQEEQTLVIAGGFGENEKVVLVMTGEAIEMATLYLDHEEADTRLLLHAKHAASDFTRIEVQSPDTDVLVLVLCCSTFSSLGWYELWSHTGARDKTRCIPVHSISVSIGPSLCRSTVLVKRKHGMLLKRVENSKEFQTALGRLGQTISL